MKKKISTAWHLPESEHTGHPKVTRHKLFRFAVRDVDGKKHIACASGTDESDARDNLIKIVFPAWQKHHRIQLDPTRKITVKETMRLTPFGESNK